ncbi:MAG: FlgD immunoglobulin-like domain containing protein, partial [Acidobacteriota bacterium]|nr:FlgD immunoglobulin-like domain containing protein [Acidobacteriota bacterium]
GSSVSIAYTLSQAASVQARVLNIAGRPIRNLFQDRAQPAGVNTVAWNLTNGDGLKVPSGLYLFEVQARTDTGQSVRAVRSLRVDRR